MVGHPEEASKIFCFGILYRVQAGRHYYAVGALISAASLPGNKGMKSFSILHLARAYTHIFSSIRTGRGDRNTGTIKKLHFLGRICTNRIRYHGSGLDYTREHSTLGKLVLGSTRRHRYIVVSIENSVHTPTFTICTSSSPSLTQD